MTVSDKSFPEPRGPWRLLYTSDPSNLAFYQAGRHLDHTATAEFATGDPGRPEDLTGWVDELAHSGVDAYAQAVFAQGWTVFFRSENFESDTRPQHRRFAAMLASGPSPLEVLIEQTHQRDMAFIAKFRMSDTHGSGTQGARFLLDNKQWWVPEQPGALDYRIDQIRDYVYGVANEIVDRFDVDGLLFNYIRFGHCFPRDVAAESQPVMTGFLQRVREMLDRHARDRQKDLTLGVMVPQTLKECHGLGYDVPTWIDQGLIDYVCPCDIGFADFNARYEAFGELTRSSECFLYPSLTPMLCRNDQATLLRPENYHALAQNFYGTGADGVSVFNYQYHWARRGGTARYAGPVEGRLLGLSYLRGLRNPQDLFRQVRHYRFHPLWCGSNRTGFEKNDRLVLPRQSGARETYRFRLCGELADSDRVELYFTAQGLVPEDKIRVDVNGVEVVELKRVFHADGRLETRGRELPPFSTGFFDVDGRVLTGRDNDLGVRLTKSARATDEKIVIDEVEVVVIPESPVSSRTLL